MTESVARTKRKHVSRVFHGLERGAERRETPSHTTSGMRGARTPHTVRLRDRIDPPPPSSYPYNECQVPNAPQGPSGTDCGRAPRRWAGKAERTKRDEPIRGGIGPRFRQGPAVGASRRRKRREPDRRGRAPAQSFGEIARSGLDRPRCASRHRRAWCCFVAHQAHHRGWVTQVYANEPVETQDTSQGTRTPRDAPGGAGRPQDANAADLLSVGEAAQHLGLLLSKVDRAMRNGRLPYVRVGARRDRFVTRSDLEAWAAKRHAGG